MSKNMLSPLELENIDKELCELINYRQFLVDKLENKEQETQTTLTLNLVEAKISMLNKSIREHNDSYIDHNAG